MVLILCQVIAGGCLRCKLMTNTDPDHSANVLVYYNARSGWAVGLESIGVSKLLYLYNRQ